MRFEDAKLFCSLLSEIKDSSSFRLLHILSLEIMILDDDDDDMSMVEGADLIVMCCCISNLIARLKSKDAKRRKNSFTFSPLDIKMCEGKKALESFELLWNGKTRRRNSKP